MLLYCTTHVCIAHDTLLFYVFYLYLHPFINLGEIRIFLFFCFFAVARRHCSSLLHISAAILYLLTRPSSSCVAYTHWLFTILHCTSHHSGEFVTCTWFFFCCLRFCFLFFYYNFFVSSHSPILFILN